MFMENMTSSGLRLNSLMSPASNLEKYLSRLVICVVGVIAAYLICYAIADALRVAYVHYRYSSLTGVRYIGPLAIQSPKASSTSGVTCLPYRPLSYSEAQSGPKIHFSRLSEQWSYWPSY